MTQYSSVIKRTLLVSFLALTQWVNLLGEPPFRGRLVQEPIERFLPPLLKPIPDGIYMDVPKELGNQTLAGKGFLDVTAAPFNADPTGHKDSTSALQAAIDFSRDHSLVCFFPKGIYRISETLVCRAAYRWRSHLKAVEVSRTVPIVLMGSRSGEGESSYRRPRIILSSRSPSFQNESQPSYVVDYQIFNYHVGGEQKALADKEKGLNRQFKMNFSESKYNSLFNHLFVNLDIEIEAGNPGAVGLRFNSAEGSGAQEVTINAGDGFAGMEGGSGNGGSWNNIDIRGGRLGLDLGYTGVPTPVISGLRLSGQRESAIRARVRGSLVIVGMECHFSGSGPAIVIPSSETKKNLDGALTIVDSAVVFEKNRKSLGSFADANIYLKNVFVKNASEISEGIDASSSDWIHIREFAKGTDFSAAGATFASSVVVDTKRVSAPWVRVSSSPGPPSDLISRHEIPVPFPSFESPGAADVRAYGAKGDGTADDTSSIQRAVDENRIVFIPKGYFRLTKTLKLRADTQLVGCGQEFSTLLARDPEPTSTPWPLVETFDDRRARNTLAFLGLRTPSDYLRKGGMEEVPVYALRWSSGPESIFRSLDVHPIRLSGFIGDPKYSTAKFTAPKIIATANAGGRFYNLPTEDGWLEMGDQYRILLIDGSAGPFSFYAFEPQMAQSPVYAEIRNAKNVSFYGFKSEGSATILSVKNSDRINVFGYGGLATAKPGEAMFRFENTTHWLVANFCDQFNTGTEIKALESIRYHYSKYFPIQEIADGTIDQLTSTDRPVLIKRGASEED